MVDEATKITLNLVQKTTNISAEGADPAVVFLKGAIPASLAEFSSRALHDVLTVHEALELGKTVGADVRPIKGTRGVVGALAAVGAELCHKDHSFEIIAYRTRTNLGKPRQVDSESVRKVESDYGDQTFHNLDVETGRILICPHGPDPVLLGIRGTTANSVREAFEHITTREPIERVAIFRTNQGTDAHIKRTRSVSTLRPYQSTVIDGRVETIPRILKGGHVVFRLADNTGTADCVAFRQSGPMMRISRDLLPGDRIRASGGIRRRENGQLSLNLEKIEIVNLAQSYRYRNSTCPLCEGHCESMGNQQGYRCRKCGLRLGDKDKIRTLETRSIAASSYIPPERSRRHLTRPIRQMRTVS